MDGRHHSFFDAKIALNHRRHRGDAVGRTAGVRNDVMLGFEILLVDAHDVGIVVAIVFFGGRQDNPLGAGLQMDLQLLVFGKETG